MKTYGLIGKSLSHSFSKDFFEAKIKKEGLENVRYLNFELETIDELHDLISEHPDLMGLNVTIPYKISACNFLDAVDKDAKFIGAVNTIKIIRKNEKIILEGFNTDAYGFYHSLYPYIKPIHQRALILGTGGAARAVCYVMNKFGISIQEVTRNPLKVQQMSYRMIDKETILNHEVIINTTPLGMYPNMDSYADIPYEYLTENHVLFDLIYNPAETLFLKMGEKFGASTVNGLEMLQLQAERSWEIWHS